MTKKRTILKANKLPVAKNSITNEELFSKIKYFLLGVILLLTFLAFNPVLKNNFTNWDEKSYVLDNLPLKQPIAEGVKYFFGEHFFVANYHPLTMIVYLIEYRIAALDPLIYHEINLLLHLLNVALVFAFMYLLSGKKIEVAACVSLLFGIHPMHVESVAWVAELKDVLYTFFFLGGLLIYHLFINAKKTLPFYFFTLLLCLFALLSKPAAVTFPLILILLDYYAKRKMTTKVFLEKTPFFLLSIIFGIINIKAQETSIGKVESFTVIKGIFLASYSIMSYLIKLFLPINLSALNPLPDLSASSLPMSYYAAPVAVLALFFVVYKSLKYTKVILFGFLFFMVNIALVLQFISVGGAITADRYSYVPYIGLFFILGMGFSWIYRSQNTRISSYKSFASITLIAICIVFAIMTNARCKVWKNSDTLWTDVISKNPDCWQAYLGRAEFFMNTQKYNIPAHENDITKAFEDLNKAIEINKGKDAHIYLNRGLIYAMKGKADSALADYNRVLGLGYHEYNIYIALGTTYSGIRKYDSASKYFEKVVELHGEDAQLLQNRAFTYLNAGNYKKSVEDYSKLIQISGNDASFYYFRGCANYKLELLEDALRDFSKAIDLKPDYGMAFYNRSMLNYSLNKPKHALDDAIKAKNLGLNIDANYFNELKQN